MPRFSKDAPAFLCPTSLKPPCTFSQFQEAAKQSHQLERVKEVEAALLAAHGAAETVYKDAVEAHEAQVRIPPRSTCSSRPVRSPM